MDYVTHHLAGVPDDPSGPERYMRAPARHLIPGLDHMTPGSLASRRASSPGCERGAGDFETKSGPILASTIRKLLPLRHTH